MSETVSSGKTKLWIIGAIVALILTCAVIVSVFPSASWADDQDDVSMSRISSIATSNFEKAVADNNLSGGGYLWEGGNVGGHISFVNNNLEGVPIVGMFIHQMSQGAADTSQAALSDMDTAFLDATDETNYPFSGYGHYGYLLKSLGYDSTMTDINFMSNLLRLISGGILMVFYIVSAVTSLFMGVTVKFIAAFNPFGLFNMAKIDEYNVQGTVWSTLADVSKPFSEMYNALQTLSWQVVMPLFFFGVLVTVAWWLRAKAMSGNNASANSILDKLKKLLIRGVFIVIGIPMLGMLYTSALNTMANEMTTQNLNADSLIASQFVDFEAWVNANRLQLPADVELFLEPDTASVTAGEPTAATYSASRQTAFKINKASGLFANLTDAHGGLSSGAGANWNTDSEGYYNGSAAATNPFTSFTDSINLILRYMNGSTIESSVFEATVKSEAQQALDADSRFSSSDLVTYLKGLSDAGNYANGSFQVNDEKDPDLAALNNKLLWFDGGKLGTLKLSDGSFKFYGQPSDGKYGMSIMAMYNYLNSDFNASGIKSYSTDRAVTNMSMLHHYSVSMVGTGFYGVMLWANTCMLLLAFSILSIAYLFGMLFNNMKHGVMLITSLPFGMLGVIPSIVKVVTLVIVMIVEILMTFFAYAFMCDILLMLNDWTVTKLPNLFDNTFTYLTHSNSDMVFLFVGAIVSIILLIGFIITSLRVRKTLVKAVNELVENTVDRIINTGTQTSTASAGRAAGVGAAIGGIAGNVAGGAMMAKRMGAMQGQNANGAPEVGAAIGAKGGADGGAADGDGSAPDAGGLPSAGGAPAGQQGVEGADMQGVGADAGSGGADAPGAPDASADTNPRGVSVKVDSNDSNADAAVATQMNRATGATSVSQDDADADAKSSIRKAAAMDTAVHGAKAVARGMGGDVAGAASEGAQGVAAAQRGARANQDVDAARARRAGSIQGQAPMARSNDAAQRMQAVQQQGQHRPGPQQPGAGTLKGAPQAPTSATVMPQQPGPDMPSPQAPRRTAGKKLAQAPAPSAPAPDDGVTKAEKVTKKVIKPMNGDI